METLHHKAASNALWVIGCRIAQSVFSLIISMLTARYLGPSNYGLINYAASIVAFMVPIVKLGFDGILVQEIVENQKDEGKILGTAMILNGIAAVAAVIGVIVFVSVANPGETETLIVCGLYSLQLIVIALETIQYWYQAKLLSKYTSIISLGVYVLISCYKIFLLTTQKSVRWFAVSNAIDYLVIGVSLIALYKHRFRNSLTFSWKTGRHLMSVGKYYIVANMMVAVFGQTASIMLKMVTGDATTGYYSAALSCAGVTSFVFSAIIDTMRPIILNSKKMDPEQYERNIIHLYSMVIYLSLAQSLAISFGAEAIVGFVYGDAYAASGKILKLLIWYTGFSYIGPVRNIWLLAEEKHSQIWKINLLGAITNIVLLLVFVPKFGAIGAALATVLTQVCTNVVTGFFIKEIRHINTLLFKSLHPKYIHEVAQSNRNNKKVCK